MVVLPDHLHAVWTLPPGDADYSARWKQIKEAFTEAYLAAGGAEAVRSPSRTLHGERAVWQKRFWEHVCEDEDDVKRCLDYIHWNPVKHGYVSSPADWLHSSFHRWVKAGVYDPEWGAARHGPLSFDDLNETAMELVSGGLCPPDL